MALRNIRSVVWKPKGLSDAVDGQNAFSGAMAGLSNWIPDPSTTEAWVCRPAAVSKTTFGSLSTPGFVSGLLVVGDIAYGTIATATFAGKDAPFAYNISTNTFLTVSGSNTNNVPTSPATTGDWTPPILCQVGGRVVVTHPGFAGGATKFGWFDVSGFSLSTTGNTNTSVTITGNPTILGVQPGMTISGTNIPAAATVISTAPFTLSTIGNTHSSTTLDTLAATTGIAIGQTAVGQGIPSGTTVANFAAGVVTLSAAATSTLIGIAVSFGGATMTLSAAATGSTNSSALTIAGGSTTNPLWGAGDTNLNNLVSVPVGVGQMNGRAFFCLGVDGLQFSDSGLACQISNSPNVQALLPDNGLAVTSIGTVGLGTLSGGSVQSLIAFQGIAGMQQITGDPTTNNLAMNALPVSTGTLAPLSIAPCTLGLAFVSPEGMRIVDLNGKVSNPIGDHGSGVTVPFLFAYQPSRICAAANSDAIRISVINGSPGVAATQEYWYDITRTVWSGPHTFPASQIRAWNNTFIMAASGINAQLWQSDAVPSLSSTFTENGSLLTSTSTTVLLPDNPEGRMNAMVEAGIKFALGANLSATVSALDENSTVLDLVTIPGGGVTAIWGANLWGVGIWGGQGTSFRKRPIDWRQPIVFNQIQIQASVQSDYSARLGNLEMKHELLGYQVPA